MDVLTVAELDHLSHCENIIEKGFKTFYEVGKALLEIRDQRLYRQRYATFEEYCQQRWQIGQSSAYQFMNSVNVIDNLKSSANGGTLPQNERQIRPLAQLETPEQQIEAWQNALLASDGKPKSTHVKNAVALLLNKTRDKVSLIETLLEKSSPDVRMCCTKHNVSEPDTIKILNRIDGTDTFWEIYHSGYIQPGEPYEAVHITESPIDVQAALNLKSKIHAQIAMDIKNLNGDVKLANHQYIQQSNSNEWYTPLAYIEAARQVMGQIDIDPASNDQANQNIRANIYYTAATNGLDKTWQGRCWLNPPYGRIQGLFIEKLLEEYRSGNVKEAIVLVNAHATETDWFAPLWEFLLCFTDHRINFISPDGEKSGSTHGSVLIYLGDNEPAFYEAFRPFGYVVKQVRYEYPQSAIIR